MDTHQVPTPPTRFQPPVNLAAIASIAIVAVAVLLVRFMMQPQEKPEQ